MDSADKSALYLYVFSRNTLARLDAVYSKKYERTIGESYESVDRKRALVKYVPVPKWSDQGDTWKTVIF